MTLTTTRTWFAALLVLLASGATSAADAPGFRVLSWNISENTFETRRDAFEAQLRWGAPDIVLLDEVSPAADTTALHSMLGRLAPDGDWSIDVGASGGRQRGLIASLYPVQTLPEFSASLPYSPADRQRISAAMGERARNNPDWSMDGGIPVNGALVKIGDRTLLAVVADLQCCGDGPESWQEMKRRIEAREIRAILRAILSRVAVDGMILAGDFNLVNSTFGLGVLAGPYPSPVNGLNAAELYHPDGVSTWTWDGRRTPFPSNVLDYQLYSASALGLRSGLVLDTENLAVDFLKNNDLQRGYSALTGRHRPLLAVYEWQ